MKRLPLIFILVLLFSFVVLFKGDKAWATATTLTAAQDAMIQSLNPTSEYGSNSNLDVMRSYPPQAHPTLEGKTRSLIQFDISSIPSNATITSATFSIYLYGCGSWSQTVDDLNIGRNKDAWEEYVVNWSNKPSFDTSSVINSTAPCSSDDQYLNYDIKTFVVNWLNGTNPNYGIVLYGNEVAGVSWIKFFHGREASANKPPKLAVAYTLPNQSTNGNTNNETGEDGDSDSSSESEKVEIQPNKETATDSATPSAKISTPSSSAASTSKEKGISPVKIALLTALILTLAGIGGYYFLIYRKKKKLSGKKEPEKSNQKKQETKPPETSNK